jgi:Tetratricopeptide repeat
MQDDLRVQRNFHTYWPERVLMSDANSNQTLMALLAPNAEEPATSGNAATPSGDDGMPALPTLDQRTDMFLRAVHGPNHSITAEMRSATRDRLISAMAADLADQIMGRASAPVDPTPLQSHSIAVQPLPSITAGLTRLWGSFLQHCHGLRMAAVPLVALLIVGSVWTTGWVNQRDYHSMTDKNVEPDSGRSETSPIIRSRGLSESQPVDLQVEQNLRRDIATTEAALGPSHPILARKLVDLASFLHADGRYKEAEALCLRALTIEQVALGPSNPDIVRTINELAMIYRAQGRTKEADDLIARAKQP